MFLTRFDHDTHTWKLLLTLSDNQGRIESLAFSPDGNTLVHGGGGGDTSITMWDVRALH